MFGISSRLEMTQPFWTTCFNDWSGMLWTLISNFPSCKLCLLLLIFSLHLSEKSGSVSSKATIRQTKKVHWSNTCPSLCCTRYDSCPGCKSLVQILEQATTLGENCEWYLAEKHSIRFYSSALYCRVTLWHLSRHFFLGKMMSPNTVSKPGKTKEVLYLCIKCIFSK